MTIITLHYYSDSVQSLPRLRFFVVPNDFDIWDAPTASYSYVEVNAVPPSGEPAGQRNRSIHVNFKTNKLMLLKHASSHQFAVSELKFSACKSKLV